VLYNALVTAKVPYLRFQWSGQKIQLADEGFLEKLDRILEHGLENPNSYVREVAQEWRELDIGYYISPPLGSSLGLIFDMPISIKINTK
jgi:hypothetical protein